jgi:sugar phosphate isomerase/epimerase
MNTLELGIVTDEISSDLPTALEYAEQWNIRNLEIRCVSSGRVPYISDYDRELLFAVATDGRFSITALSPGIFKFPLSKIEELRNELETTLPATIGLAKELGCGMIIVFGFQKDEHASDTDFTTAVEIMKQAAALAEKAHIIIAVENEPGFWCDTGSSTARLLSAVDSPALQANWDPANAFGTDERPFPEGYKALKPHIVNVHAKDTLKGSLIECVPVGEGLIDWKGQIVALEKDRVVGHITIETHCHPLIERSLKNVQRLREYFAEGDRT